MSLDLGSSPATPIDLFEKSNHVYQSRKTPRAGPLRRQLPAADIGRRPPGVLLSTDRDRNPLDRRCNARCVHCDIWKNRGKESLPSVENWKATLRDLRRWLGPVHVVFTGGEALLMPFAPEVVSHASAVGLLVEHLTHGFWLDQTRIEKMAMGNPMRVTISCDGIGATHDKIRGREHFFDAVETTIETLLRLRRDHKLGYAIRLKTVIMEHNLHDVSAIARYAQARGLEVWYQPIEQNYNTPEDPRWFEHSPTWPKDRERAAAAVAELIELKREGLPITNSEHQLEVMIPYFRDPEKLLDPDPGTQRPRKAPLFGAHDASDPVQRRRQGVLVHGPDRQHHRDAHPPDLGTVPAGGNRDVVMNGGCPRPRERSLGCPSALDRRSEDARAHVDRLDLEAPATRRTTASRGWPAQASPLCSEA